MSFPSHFFAEEADDARNNCISDVLWCLSSLFQRNESLDVIWVDPQTVVWHPSTCQSWWRCQAFMQSSHRIFYPIQLLKDNFYILRGEEERRSIKSRFFDSTLDSSLDTAVILRQVVTRLLRCRLLLKARQRENAKPFECQLQTRFVITLSVEEMSLEVTLILCIRSVDWHSLSFVKGGETRRLEGDIDVWCKGLNVTNQQQQEEQSWNFVAWNVTFPWEDNSESVMTVSHAFTLFIFFMKVVIISSLSLFSDDMTSVFSLSLFICHRLFGCLVSLLCLFGIRDQGL